MNTDDLNRTYTRRLSELLSSADGAATLALLQKLQRAHAPEAPAPDADAGTDTVGVWRRTGTELVRDAGRREEWRYWADLERVPLPVDRRRVVLLGESAARGYFFDPAHNLATLLGDALGRISGLSDVQVVDLARTNATHVDLEATAHQAVALAPDALVVLAGNNWHNLDLTPGQMQLLAGELRSGGFGAARTLFHRLVVEQAGRTLDALAATAHAAGAPITLVVPEFNLADWQDERSLVCPVLPGEDSRVWLELRAQAQLHLARGEHEQGAAVAERMRRLDGGSSHVSARLLADALAGHRPAEAEQALVTAKDTVVSPFTLHSPRVLAAVQDEMRRKADEHGFLLVDLPKLLRAADGDRAPGRRFFMDYCHLTFEGLALTAAAAAARLADQLGAPATTTEELLSAQTRPASATLAVAHFLAAVHNSHYGQPAHILRHHLDEALAHDPAVAVHLENYLDYQTRVTPHWMCASYEKSAQVPELARYLVVSDTRLTGKLADHDLREEMVRALESTGVPTAKRYEDLLVAEHARAESDLLVDAAQAATFRERRGSGVGTRTAFLRAADLTSEFHLVVDEPTDTELRLTWRLPAGETDADTVQVAVNGTALAAQRLGTAWQNTELTLPAALLRRGRNVITIGWPLRAVDGHRLVEDAAAALERGTTPSGFPAYGHLFACTARPLAATRD
ncbi:hypothetical protein ACFW88_00070 [Streptomyces anandii]|uniref:SGNH hydrolase-type esterase domain-containing protein n=1 Tax=Streptomyces anandii TaxID=285454 RepID=A0ABW6GX43_9ACTN